MDSQILYIVTASLFGIVAGAGIMYFLSNKSADSAKSVAQVEEKLTKYQDDVVSHFEQTADLVDELTQSYKKVFDHLGQSARQLLTDEQVQEQIEKRKDNKVTLAFLTNEGSDILKEELIEKENKEKPVEEQKEKAIEEADEIIADDTSKLDSKVEDLVEEIEAEMKKEG